VSWYCLLANPHEFILPSSAELVSSFMKDLSRVLDVSVTSTPEEFTILFWRAAGTSSTWTADRDCHLVGVMTVSGSASVALTLDGTGYTTNFAAGGDGKRGNILYLGGTSTFSGRIDCNVPIKAGQKMTFTNNGASNGALLVWLT
jgi:hypothetical protein